MKLIDPFRPHEVSVGICTFTVSIEAVDHVTNQQVLGLLLNMERKQRLKCGTECGKTNTKYYIVK